MQIHTVPPRSTRRPSARRRWRSAGLALAGVFALLPCARAGTVYSNDWLVSTATAPVTQTFTPGAAQAGRVDVTVTDTAFPVALASLSAAVTRGGTVLASGAAAAGSPSSVTLSFDATAGVAYAIRLVGAPDPASGAGTVIVSVTPSGARSTVYTSFPATFQAPVATAGVLNVQQPVTFPEAGTYVATLTDLTLPAPVAGLSAAVFPGQGSGGPITTVNPGSPATFAVTSAGNYQLRIIGAPAAAGGLFSLRIEGGPSGSVVYPGTGASGVTALGAVSGPQPVVNPASGIVTLAAVDLNVPSALTSLGAVLTDPAGALVARQCLTPCGAVDPSSGAAPAGTLQLWRVATAGATGGSELTSVTAGPNILYSDAETVAAPAATATQRAFVFPFQVPASGSYTVGVGDLEAPAGLAGLQFAVFQGSQLVANGSSATAGQLTVALSAGAAEVRVIATLPAAGASGIFGLQVATAAPTPAVVLATSQAVGATTGTQTLSISGTTSGAYVATVTDAHWPAAFRTLNVFLTSGATVLAKFYSGGTTPPIFLPAGTYQLTYSAVPDATAGAGLFALAIDSAPLPTVALSASPTSITAGESVALTWTSTDATTCAASGGWSGTQATSGTGIAQGPLQATTTFTLQCSGAGGNSAPASVTVTVAAKPASGGGGTFDLVALALLASAGFARRFRIASQFN
jgi:hypothetical protein